MRKSSCKQCPHVMKVSYCFFSVALTTMAPFNVDLVAMKAPEKRPEGIKMTTGDGAEVEVEEAVEASAMIEVVVMVIVEAAATEMIAGVVMETGVETEGASETAMVTEVATETAVATEVATETAAAAEVATETAVETEAATETVGETEAAIVTAAAMETVVETEAVLVIGVETEAVMAIGVANEVIPMTIGGEVEEVVLDSAIAVALTVMVAVMVGSTNRLMQPAVPVYNSSHELLPHLTKP